AASSSETDAMRHDRVTVAPTVPASVRVRYLDPGAPWAAQIGAEAGGTDLRAAVAARVHLKYDDTAAGIDHTETYECIFYPLMDALKPEDAHVVDYDERDLRADAPANASYGLPDAPIDKAAFFNQLERQLAEHLYRTRKTD